MEHYKLLTGHQRKKTICYNEYTIIIEMLDVNILYVEIKHENERGLILLTEIIEMTGTFNQYLELIKYIRPVSNAIISPRIIVKNLLSLITYAKFNQI